MIDDHGLEEDLVCMYIMKLNVQEPLKMNI